MTHGTGGGAGCYRPAHLDALGVSGPVHRQHVGEPGHVDQRLARGVMKRAVDPGAARLPAIVYPEVPVPNFEQRGRPAAAGGERCHLREDPCLRDVLLHEIPRAAGRARRTRAREWCRPWGSSLTQTRQGLPRQCPIRSGTSRSPKRGNAPRGAGWAPAPGAWPARPHGAAMPASPLQPRHVGSCRSEAPGVCCRSRQLTASPWVVIGPGRCRSRS